MRVMVWTEVFWPYCGGAPLSVRKLLLALRSRGHEVAVVTRQDDPDLPGESRVEGIPVYRFPFYTALAGGDVEQVMDVRRRVAQRATDFAPDIVHINCFGPSILFYLETEGAYPAPLLVTLRGERYSRSREPDSLQEKALRRANWVTAPSLGTLAYARRLVPGYRPPSSCIYNGIELPALALQPLPFDPPRLLCLGRLDRNKAFDLALEAFVMILARCPHARLTIAGDGPQRASLERQAAALGVRHAVRFTGWVASETVPELINASTVVMMTSRSEALPLVSLEAAAMARPLVATRVGGVPEVVQDGRTGLLIEPGDRDGLASSVLSLLEDPATAREMGLAARERVGHCFSLERCVDAYETLYRKLAHEPC